jgi:hypothetical protein
MLNLFIGAGIVLVIVLSLIISAEYNYGNDRPIGHWVLGFIAGIGAAILTIWGIWG